MPNLEFTPRNVVKFVVTAAIQSKTTELTKQAIDDYTSLDADSTSVGIGANVVGWYVSDKLKPVTNKMVDKTADIIVAKREARKAKKNAKQED